MNNEEVVKKLYETPKSKTSNCTRCPEHCQDSCSHSVDEYRRQLAKSSKNIMESFRKSQAMIHNEAVSGLASDTTGKKISRSIYVKKSPE